LFDDAKYHTCECAVAVDDFVMLFTDGLFEVEAADDKIYSRERLMNAVRERMSLPPAKLFAELFGDSRLSPLTSSKRSMSTGHCSSFIGKSVTFSFHKIGLE
jgi:hypothetical protein